VRIEGGGMLSSTERLSTGMSASSRYTRSRIEFEFMVFYVSISVKPLDQPESAQSQPRVSKERE